MKNLILLILFLQAIFITAFSSSYFPEENTYNARCLEYEELIGLLLALHSTPESYKYCKDNKTLVVVKNAFWEINNKTYNITKNEEIQCRFGCNFETNECNEPAYKTYIIIAGLIFVILIIILIIRAYL